MSYYRKPWDAGHWLERNCQRFADWKGRKSIPTHGRWWSIAADINELADTPEKRIRGALDGMIAGEADWQIYFRGGKIVLVNLKTNRDELSDDQIDRHAHLKRLGFQVYTIYLC